MNGIYIDQGDISKKTERASSREAWADKSQVEVVYSYKTAIIGAGQSDPRANAQCLNVVNKCIEREEIHRIWVQNAQEIRMQAMLNTV
jgi:hypothetical protein